MNQFSQNGVVAERLVRHTHGRVGSVGSLSSYIKEGTEARAEAVLRIVRERVLRTWLVQGFSGKMSYDVTYCHSMPDASDGNRTGRVDKYLSMLCRASMAEPMKLVRRD